MFAPDGTIDSARLEDAVMNDSYESLPEKMADALSGIDAQEGAFPFCLELNDTNCINDMNYAFPEQPRTYFILCATTSLIAARAGVRYCRGSK